ncbi:hypothetical protein D049_4998 [Vibrio parahaemolyticus VPTS-2010]|nr:hypothetical protein D049_4998 [Vibrio parahaemolyticus VPTS-2010]
MFVLFAISKPKLLLTSVDVPFSILSSKQAFTLACTNMKESIL